MNPNKNGTIPMIVAFLVLFSALLAPLLMAALSIGALIVLGIYRFVSDDK